MTTDGTATVVALHRDPGHGLGKAPEGVLTLLAGLGVEGDAHCGATVRHRSRVAADPLQPNLRQVHLIASELHSELQAAGFDVGPGDMGENITTRGVDLLALPTGTTLRIGSDALVVITGLRNPCSQLDGFRPGLMGAVLERAPDGRLTRRAGVMGVVVLGGTVAVDDSILVGAPPGVPAPLAPV